MKCEWCPVKEPDLLFWRNHIEGCPVWSSGRINELEAKVEALEAGICEHIEWAEKVVDCDALAALLTGGGE